MERQLFGQVSRPVPAFVESFRSMNRPALAPVLADRLSLDTPPSHPQLPTLFWGYCKSDSKSLIPVHWPESVHEFIPAPQQHHPREHRRSSAQSEVLPCRFRGFRLCFFVGHRFAPAAGCRFAGGRGQNEEAQDRSRAEGLAGHAALARRAGQAGSAPSPTTGGARWPG